MCVGEKTFGNTLFVREWTFEFLCLFEVGLIEIMCLKENRHMWVLHVVSRMDILSQCVCWGRKYGCSVFFCERTYGVTVFDGEFTY